MTCHGHDLLLRRPFFRKPRSRRLAKPVSAAMRRQVRLVALLPEPVSEPGRRKTPFEFSHQERQLATRRSVDALLQLRVNRQLQRYRLALAALELSELQPAVVDVLLAEQDNVAAALAGVEQQVERQAGSGAKRVAFFELRDLGVCP